ncbi:MAG: hypothetical protein H7287_02885 [Thermoleophilia bacterium]|nr:hypothetical protein [Thermoleophilia bacterium]
MDLGGTSKLVGATARRLVAVARPAADDAIGVVRGMVAKTELERLEPALRGKLDAPAVAGEALIGAKRMPGDVKVATANLHMGTPAGGALNNVGNESIDALRGDAAAILREDPDVVFLQEVRQHAAGTGTAGVAEQASVMAHLLGASDVVFTPAVARIEGLHEGYGTAIVLRRGAKFEDVFNARLTNHDPAIEARSVGVGHVRFADGNDALVANTHLANRPQEDIALRVEQLHDIGGIVDGARAGGTATYRDVATGAEHTVAGLPTRGVILAGDMNQMQHPTSQVLDQHGLTNIINRFADNPNASAKRVLEASAPTAEHQGTYHRIDHIEVDDTYDVADAGLAKVGTLIQGDTDHHFVMALLRPKGSA